MTDQHLFRFKKFSLTDDGCAMKIGTDGVLLGAYAARFAEKKKPSRILDIGTGCGIIAMMIAQKSDATIHAIDLDIGAISTARKNAENSPWAEQLEFYHESLQDFGMRSVQLYNLIVCNPPYFQNSLTSLDSGRTLARHDTSLGMDELFSHSARLMDQNGILLIIFPADRAEELSQCAQSNGFWEFGRLQISASPGVAPKRVICEFSRHETNERIVSEMEIETGQRHSFSDAYRQLTFDYHPFFH